MYDFQTNSQLHRLDRSPFTALRVDASPVHDRDSKAGIRWSCVMTVADATTGSEAKTPVHTKKEGDSNTENEVARA